MTPVWGVETDSKEGFKDIVKAADDFAAKVGSGKGVDKDKIHRSTVKRNSFKEKTSQIKSKNKGNPKVIPREKEESPHSQTKLMERVRKKRGNPQQDRGENTSKGGKKITGKSGSKEKTTAARMAAKQKETSKSFFVHAVLSPDS